MTIQNARRRPLEADGTAPTLPLLERLASALGLTVTISLAPMGAGQHDPGALGSFRIVMQVIFPGLAVARGQ